VHLYGGVERAPRSDPLVAFVNAMCLFAQAVDAGSASHLILRESASAALATCSSPSRDFKSSSRARLGPRSRSSDVTWRPFSSLGERDTR
jgi:hypothetical protein